MGTLRLLSFSMVLWQAVFCTSLSVNQRFIVDRDPISCDFEASSICGYTQDKTDTFDWTRHSGKTQSQDTGPNNDHTKGGATGNYMYIESSSPRKRGDIARLVSPVAHTDGGRYSVSFYYNMFGNGVGTLMVYVDSGNGNVYGHSNITVTGNHGTSWRHECIDIPARSTFKIVFEGTVGLNYHGDIAIDDVKLKTGTCSHTSSTGSPTTTHSGPVNAAALSCNFENGLCGYTQARTDNRDWSRHTGNTASHLTGPSKDHTTVLGKGFYVYLESSSPAKAGDKALLLSPTVTASSGQHSVTFWYHMYGAEMGTLNVYLKRGSSQGTPLVHISGNQGNVWRQACIDIPIGIGVFQLVFEGIVGQTFHGDMAVDDIRVSSSHCSMTTPMTTSVTSTTDPTMIAVTIDIKPFSGSSSTSGSQFSTTTSLPPITGSPLSSVTCNFDEEHACGYTMTSQSTLVKYNWQWITGQTINIHTGPARDHTTGRGHYMAAVSLGTTSAVGARANLYSPYFDSTGKQLSVHFWYNTFSSSQNEYGAFYVYLDNNGQHSNALFSATQAHHSTSWHEACVNIPPNLQHVRLLFQAVHGDGVHGDIAVDDVTLTFGKCGSPSVTSTSPSSQGHWSPWSAFSPCSHTCGAAVRVSSRHCTGGSFCPGSRTRALACHLTSCDHTSTTTRTTTTSSKIDGAWSSWTTWSQCSVSCGLGSISRNRKCSNPTPSSGSRNCTGGSSQTHDCTMGPCPVWSHWYDGSCSVSCGNGTKEQFRHCSTGHDEDCTGSPFQQVPCVNALCI